MKITNKTKWRTDHLRRFILRVGRDELDPEKLRVIRVEIGYNRGVGAGYVTGRAYIGGTRMRLMLGSRAVDRCDLAHVIAHEMAHLRGVRHGKDMNCPRYRHMAGMQALYAWAEQMPLEQKSPPKRPTIEQRRERRLADAQSKLRAWQRKLKLANTLVKKWQRRVRALERSQALPLAASSSPNVADSTGVTTAACSPVRTQLAPAARDETV